jgi:hypothetical protein
MKTKLFTLLFLTILFINLTAQNTCGSMQYLEKILSEHPELISEKNKFEDRMNITSLRENIEVSNKTDGIIRIPIVVHIVYNTPVQNISDAQVMSQIDALNRDFNNRNPDSLPSSHQLYNIVGNPTFEFCLAVVDDNLNPTTGITRNYTSQTLFDLDAGTSENVKLSSFGGVDAWDPAKYLNIWVCNLAGPVLGYARFPFSIADDPFADGLVIGYTSFGGIGTSTDLWHAQQYMRLVTG